MFAAQTELKKAQMVKEHLLKRGLMNQDYLPVKELGLIYFPLIKEVKVPGAKVVNTKFSFPKKEKPPKVEELLKGKLTVQEMRLIPHSQEIVGKIMILEIPEELKKKEQLIAEAYLKSNKSVETVVKKNKIHHGDYRLRKVKVLAGINTKETVHLENGVKIKLHLEKAYFSARLAHERLRIAQQVKKGEEILVMFSGAGPYLLVIGKNSLAKKIYGIEINPLAHQYALENIQINKLSPRVIVEEGDVRRLLPKFKKKFDRIIMPLPKTGDEFLPLALTKAKKNTIIHFYAFLKEADVPAEKKKILEICQKAKHPVKVLRHVNCGQFAPYVFRMCFDLRVLK